MRSRIRRIIAPMAAVVAGLALGACQTSEPSGNVGYGPGPKGAETILATDDRFNTSVIEADAGETIVVEVTNVGDSNHEFSIPDAGLTTGTIEPGDSAWARFEVPDGTTTFVCSYHGDMDGVIRGE